jgi:subtilisin family serine protease
LLISCFSPLALLLLPLGLTTLPLSPPHAAHPTPPGNNARSACGYSPASAPEAITVSATTGSDARAPYSNFGRCADIFAPGASIISAAPAARCANGTGVMHPTMGCRLMMSGTSMSAPHVAGVVALAWSQLGPGARAEEVRARVLASWTPGAVLDARGKGPLLVYNQLGARRRR